MDFTAEEPVILRPGYYSAKQLEKAAGIKIAEGVKKSSKAGCEQKDFAALKYKHYSVNAEMTVFEGEKTAVADRIKSLVKQNEGCKVAIICSDETKMLYGELYTISLGSISDENAIAARLFEVLRELNESDIECIYCETFYTEKLGDAIMNRLLKAADERLVKV